MCDRGQARDRPQTVRGLRTGGRGRYGWGAKTWLRTVAVASVILHPLVSYASLPAPSTEHSEGGRVAVIGIADSEVTMRIAAELTFLGFSPVVVAPPPTLDRRSLTDLARSSAAAAAISVTVDGDEIDIGIADRVTGKFVARSVNIPATAPARSREIAVRSVELLRSSLAELEETREPPPGAEVPVSPSVRRNLTRPHDRLLPTASIAVGGAPGGLPVAAHIRARLRYAPHPRFGVVVGGTAPLHAVRASAPEGTARIHTGWLGVGPWFSLRPPTKVVVPDLAITAGPVFVGMQGQAAPGLVDDRVTVLDTIFEAAVGLEVAVSPRVRIRLESAAAVCARTIRVRFAGRSVATWCRPYVLGAVGIGVVAW